MKEVKIGLIGLGFMGTTHFGVYKNLAGAKVCAIADICEAKRSGDISSVIGNIGGGDNSKPLDLSGIEIYEDAFEMIKNADVDIIDICVPTTEHIKYVVAAVNADKHVLCEKPICRNVEQLKEIKEVVSKSKKFFNVDMCIRAWPEYHAAKEILDSGKVGAVKNALFRRLSPNIDGNSWENWYMTDERSGGAALDLHLHDTDFVCHMFGRPEKVQSVGARGVVSDNGIDQIITQYKYNDNKFITAEGGWCAAKGVVFEMSFQIVCEKATLKLDSNGFNIYWNNGDVETPKLDCGDLPTGWHRQLSYFVDCVRDNVEPNKYQNFQSISDALCVVSSEMQSVDSQSVVEVKYV